jgi:hypothetical protein
LRVEKFFYTFGALCFIETYTCFIEFTEPMFTEPESAGRQPHSARMFFRAARACFSAQPALRAAQGACARLAPPRITRYIAIFLHLQECRSIFFL